MAVLEDIERWLPLLSPDFHRGLATLIAAADEAARHRGGPKNLRDAFGSSKSLFIRMVGEAYSEATGRDPGVSRNNKSDDICGPFVRFVQEAARQYDVPEPDGETIRKALTRKRRRKA
jgi:hypothetical protein